MQKYDRKITGLLHELSGKGNALRLKKNCLKIIEDEGQFNPTEIRDFKLGTIRYGLYQRDFIPNLLIEIADKRFDYFVNAYNLLPAIQRENLKHYSGEINFTIVCSRTTQFVVERKFCSNTHFAAHLKSCFQKQLEYYHSEYDVRNKILELEEFLTTEEMFRSGDLYKYPVMNYQK